MKKILVFGAFMIVLVLGGVFASAVTETKNLDCGNSICEKYIHVFENAGETDSITLESKPVTIQFISGVAGDDNNNVWNINGVRGSMSEISNNYLNPVNNNFDFFINIGDYSKYDGYDYIGKEVYIKEEHYCPLDCVNDAGTDNRIKEITIHPGWNLLGLGTIDFSDCGFEPEGTICKDDILVEFAYIPLLKKYIDSNTFNKGEGSSQSEIEAVEKSLNSLTSRWVYAKDSVSSKKAAITLFAGQALTPVNLSAGWNFISITSPMIGKSLDGIKGTCGIEKAYGWYDKEKPEGSWLNVLNYIDQGGKHQQIIDYWLGDASSVGYGFVVKVSSDCTFGTESLNSEEVASPPSIPQ